MNYIKFYTDNCKTLSTINFKSVVETVIEFITKDPECSPENKMLFADWISTKLYNMYKITGAGREELQAGVRDAIYKIKSPAILSRYLYFMDNDLSIKLSAGVYDERLAEIFFINQMMNDAKLLKHFRFSLEGDELLDHFVKWIKAAPEYTQKSNLLDVLLSDHGTDPRVRKIYLEMKGGESIYENKQNVHADEIAIPAKTACVKLLEWNKDATNYTTVNGERVEVDPGKWIKGFFAGAKIDPALTAGILERTMIDRNYYDLVDGVKATIFEVLYATCNYIQRSKDYNVLVEILAGELRDAIELCGTGYIERFINVLQGFDDRFQIKVAFFHQLYAKVNEIVSRAILNLPGDSNVILGTYDKEYEKYYFEFISETLDSIQMKKLRDQYGAEDVNKEIAGVLNKLTGLKIWRLNAAGLVKFKANSV